MTSRKRKNRFGSRWEGDGGAGEGRVVGAPKFHSWGECTMTLTNINSDWMSNASSSWPVYYIGLIILYYYTSKVTAPQDAHGRLTAVQVYLPLACVLIY